MLETDVHKIVSSSYFILTPLKLKHHCFDQSYIKASGIVKFLEVIMSSYQIIDLQINLDLIPFNYRGIEHMNIRKLLLSTVY